MVFATRYPYFAFSAILILYFLIGVFFTPSNATAERTWCVAKPSSDAATLLANINFACSEVDCGVLQRGYSCFSPDNLMSHASVAMNLYYKAMGCNKWNCDFKNSALLTITDPSFGSCKYV